MANWKILIVEDDALVRVALKTLVNWDEHGFNLIGEAEDGDIALTMINNLKPDIILLDMQMPVLDGMGVLKALQKMAHPPKVVVLSSYNEFELVKEAMKLGAEDYILKLNLNFDDLMQVMERVADMIIKEKGKLADERDYTGQYHRNLDAMRKNFFENLFSGIHQTPEQIVKSTEFLELDFLQETIYCFNIYIESLAVSEDREKDAIKRFAVANVVQEITGGYCFEWNRGDFIALVSGQSMKKEQLKSYGKRITEMLYEYISLDSIIGIAVTANGISGIREAYLEARETLYHQYFFKDQKVFLWNEKTQQSAAPEDYTTFIYQEKLEKALNLCAPDQISAVMDAVLADVRTKSLGREQTGKAVLYMYYMIAAYSHSNNIALSKLISENEFGYEELTRLRSRTTAIDKLEAMKAQLMQYVTEAKTTNSNTGLIDKALEYMETNFNKEISLKDVADHVGLNATYLSNLMKKSHGKSYSELLIDLRIKKAKHLIRTTDYKVYLVAELVGYPNTFYFNRIFKNRTGMTPVEYKNHLHL